VTVCLAVQTDTRDKLRSQLPRFSRHLENFLRTLEPGFIPLSQRHVHLHGTETLSN